MAKQEVLSIDGKKPPRFFYGYVIVFVSLIIMTLTFGTVFSYGVFFKPLTAEFGWSKAVTSAAYSIRAFLAGFLGVLAGRLTDRFDSRLVSIAGGVFLGLGSILMSQINDVWQFYVVHGLIVAAGVGGCWPALMATVPRWFEQRRGLMLGIVSSGTGLGTIFLPPAVTWLIATYGWRFSYIIVGVLVLVLIVVSALFIKRDPQQTGQILYGNKKTTPSSPISRERLIPFREIINNKRFWIMCVIYFCFGFGLHSIMVHIVPYAIELGITPETAASVLSTIGGISIVSMLLVGYLSTKLGVKLSLVYNFIIWIAALLWLQISDKLWMLYLFALAFGFAYGGLIMLQSFLAAELFGLGSLGMILGSVTFFYTFGSAIGPLLVGYMFDVTSSYMIAFIICAILGIIALTLVMTASGKRKVLDMPQEVSNK